MGANAKRRRAAKAAAHEPGHPQPSSSANTKTMARLRAKMAQVRTRVQVEEMIADAHPDHRPAVRDLLYRLVDPALPCCGVALLSMRLREDPVKHAQRCPVGGLIVLEESRPRRTALAAPPAHVGDPDAHLGAVEAERA